MAMDREVVSRIVNNALEEHLSELVSRVVRNVTDELDSLASNVEDVISDAISSAERAGEGLDHDDVETFHERIVTDMMTELQSKGFTMVPPAPAEPPPPTIAERYKSGTVGIDQAVYEALGTAALTQDEAQQLLKLLATDYEEEFAMFMWRRSRGSAA